MPISDEFPLVDFDCGNAILNAFLTGQALRNQERRLGATTLLVGENLIVMGYYTLAPSDISQSFLPKSFGGQLPTHVPAIKLGRLAVDKKYQTNGIGGMVLAHALKTAYFQSENFGGYVVLIDVKPAALHFYKKYGMKMIRDSVEGIIMGIRTKDIPRYFEGKK